MVPMGWYDYCTVMCHHTEQCCIPSFAFLSRSTPQDLTAATLVFKIYLSRASVEGSCASKLKAILGAGCFGMGGDEIMIHSLAKVVVQVLRATLLPDQDTPLGGCVADIPAVLLSLASVSCQTPNGASPNEGMLYDPVSGIVLPCIPVSTFLGPAQGCDTPVVSRVCRAGVQHNAGLLRILLRTRLQACRHLLG